MAKEVYFDNAATTKPSRKVLDLLPELSEAFYGNPSSMHDMGFRAEQRVKSAAKSIAALIGCDYEDLVFTSGGTESNNLAILGMVGSERKKHFVTETAEHSSVLDCFRKLEQDGHAVTYLSPAPDGSVDPDVLGAAIRPDTALVSIMHVNNETGAIQDIETIGKTVRAANPQTAFHVDAVQSFGKHTVHVQRCGIDLLSISAHKIHGLKGSGALYVRPETRINPLFFGGGQQKKRRPGTENTFGIFTLAAAAEEACANSKENGAAVSRIKDRILRQTEGAVINSPETASPYILNMSFPGLKSEVLLNALAAEGIFVSAGSACSARIKTHTALTAYGKPPAIVESSVRLSFSSLNTLAEADYFIEKINTLVPRLKELWV